MIATIVCIIISLISIVIAIALLIQRKWDKEFFDRTYKKDIDALRQQVWCLENPPQLTIGQFVNITVPHYSKCGKRGIARIIKGKITSHSVKEYGLYYYGRGEFGRTYEYFDGSKISSFDESYCQYIKKPK